MKNIRSDAKNIHSLLDSARFAIDYYQREYRWEKKQVVELINDLSEKFLENHEPGNERSAVESYSHYFLGSIIISEKDNQRFIIDGQQRLTSLTLLLIYIHRQMTDDEQKWQLADLIFSQKYGKRSFNLEIEERTPCMNALFNDEPFEESDQPESVVNIWSRFQDIDECFPDELKDNVLPFFADWLVENVHLVVITAYSDADAYTIFETMNDRGLSLTPTDMLKGYLLTNITDLKQRGAASEVWRTRIANLQKLGKDEDADAIKSWLRSQHAKTIRERKRGAQPLDFDLVGTEFHRWVRDHEEKPLGLTSSADFVQFIKQDFDFYSNWYQRIRVAAETLKPGLETIHYNAHNNFTLQYPALLAPLQQGEKDDECLRKLRIVASYIDILTARRIWNGKSTSYSTMQYSMFQLVILKIRGKSSAELADILTQRLDEEEPFTSNDSFHLHRSNRRQIHRLLARMTDFVETRSGLPSHYADYIQRRGRYGYEIEHIWADRYDRHVDEFSDPANFGNYRNHIGGLLLLPKSFNASYGDKPYADKREHYHGQNLLAKSLHEKAYEHNPGFRRFMEETKLPFRPHAEFKKADMDARQNLYCDLAGHIWDPAQLQREANS